MSITAPGNIPCPLCSDPYLTVYHLKEDCPKALERERRDPDMKTPRVRDARS